MSRHVSGLYIVFTYFYVFSKQPWPARDKAGICFAFELLHFLIQGLSKTLPCGHKRLVTTAQEGTAVAAGAAVGVMLQAFGPSAMQN